MTKVFTRCILTFFLLFALINSAQTSSEPILQQLDNLIGKKQLLPGDTQFRITSESTSRVSGVHHIYFVQSLNDLDVYGTDSGIHLMADGSLLTENNKFISHTAEKLKGSPSPQITQIQAVESAARQLGYSITEPLKVLENNQESTGEIVLSDGGISKRPIPVTLVYTLNSQKILVLAYDLSIESISETNWWSVRVDASTGTIINNDNWTVNCNIGHDHDAVEERFDYNANLFDIPDYAEPKESFTSNCIECYEVFALPLQSPYFGNRTILTQPAHSLGSPYGWHDTNGIPGAEYTVTRGNNANAYEDGDNPGYQPDGGTSLNFTGYPFSPFYSVTNQYENAAITNLFYLNNVIHDISYVYGFDEESGNFQQNNYGKGGLGNDYVQAEAQDGSGTCNANFSVGPDGQKPTMQMYICGSKDGDFDAVVVMHEYAHGISNRLTGGRSTAGCLQNNEQMGEGWSDFFGAILTMKSTDAGTMPRPIGTYLFNQGANGYGIRDYPYSTNMSVNPQTYDHIKTASIPHGVGSVWAQMLWEMTWGLIDTYGFDANPYNFTGNVTIDKGNTQALALVTEGMKLQPCSPGFIDGRDAILAADRALYGGANECIIWDAFAKRGLGFSATQGSSNNVTDGTQAFDTPPKFASLAVLDEVCVSAPILFNQKGGIPYGGVYSGTGITDDGNGRTFSFDPSVAGVGVHPVTYTLPAGVCRPASSAVDTIVVKAIPNGPVTVDATATCIGESVTVSAVPNDPTNVIRWFDAIMGGDFLHEGNSYTFIPSGTTSVYAQENPPGPLSRLVISEITLGIPDQFEIQNMGVAKDYTGYKVAVSDRPFFGINYKNSIVKNLGYIGADEVVTFTDQSGTNYWGNNIWWDYSDSGWIIIIDPNGDVVDALFWNYSESQIAGLNVNIGGKRIFATDLNWTGPGADFSTDCGADSYRRHGDTKSAADWTGGCETPDFGIPNTDINSSAANCAGPRTEAKVIESFSTPSIDCPADMTVSVHTGAQYTLPDYTVLATITNNCLAYTVIQDPAVGTKVAVGQTLVTITLSDSLNNTYTCTFNLTVDDLLGMDKNELDQSIKLYPNPTSGALNLQNNSTVKLLSLTISDVNGRTIRNLNLSDAAKNVAISIEDLASGLYFIKIRSETSNIVRSIVRE